MKRSGAAVRGKDVRFFGVYGGTIAAGSVLTAGRLLRNCSSRSERRFFGSRNFSSRTRRQLADLVFGVVGAALLEDALADLLHDLLDVDRLGSDGELAHRVYLSAVFGSGVPPAAGKLGRFLDAGAENAE